MVADKDAGRFEAFDVLETGYFKTHANAFQRQKDLDAASAPIRIGIAVASDAKAGTQNYGQKCAVKEKHGKGFGKSGNASRGRTIPGVRIWQLPHEPLSPDILNRAIAHIGSECALQSERYFVNRCKYQKTTGISINLVGFNAGFKKIGPGSWGWIDSRA
jgi:hypothetical protein